MKMQKKYKVTVTEDCGQRKGMNPWFFNKIKLNERGVSGIFGDIDCELMTMTQIFLEEKDIISIEKVYIWEKGRDKFGGND